MHLSRLSFFLTLTGMLLVATGLILPSAFGTARAQMPYDQQPQQTTPASQSVPATPPPVPTEVQQRDPFIPEGTTPETNGIPTSTDTAPEAQANQPQARETAGSASASDAPLHTQDQIVGIVVGDHPYVLVNQSGKSRILSVGDTLSGRKIARITLREVRFDDSSSASIPLVDQ